MLDVKWGDMSLRNVLRALHRGLGLTSMRSVLKELRKRSIRLEELNGLEVFGGSGEFHTKDYASQVLSLEIWEIDPRYEKALKSNFPLAEVKITDAFEALRSTPRKYGLVVVDNPLSTWGKYCEHFDVFPDIFRVLKDSTIVILNVKPKIDRWALRAYPYVFNETHLARRGSFYKTSHPEKIPLTEMVPVYNEIIINNGFDLEWHFFQRRWGLRFWRTIGYYLVLKIHRSDRTAEIRAVRKKEVLANA